MNYSIGRIVRNLISRWKSYLLLLISFAVGISILTVCLAYHRSSTMALQELKENLADREIHLDLFGHGLIKSYEELTDPVSPIPYEVYHKIQENPLYQKELKILYATHFNDYILNMKEMVYLEFKVYYMNNDLFYELYGKEQELGVAYVGEAAYKTLHQVNEIAATDPEALIYTEPNFSMSLKGEELILNDGTTYQIEIVNLLDPDQTLLSAGTYDSSKNDMQNAVILPVDKVVDLPPLAELLYNQIILKYRDAQWQEDLVPAIVKELSEGIPPEYTDAYFVLSDEYLDLKGTIDSSNFVMSQWLVFAGSVVLLTGIGCVGLMFILMQRRKQFFAVSIAFGSTRRRIMAENIAEVGIVLLLGGVIGLFCSPLLKGILYYRHEISFAASGVFVMLGCGLCFALGAVALGMLSIRFKNIAQSLKEE